MQPTDLTQALPLLWGGDTCDVELEEFQQVSKTAAGCFVVFETWWSLVVRWSVRCDFPDFPVLFYSCMTPCSCHLEVIAAPVPESPAPLSKVCVINTPCQAGVCVHQRVCVSNDDACCIPRHFQSL